MPVGAAVQQSPSSSSQSTSCQTIDESQGDNNMSVTRDNHRRRRRRRENWVTANNSGNILYRPENAAERTSAAESAPGFPAPLIGPRRTRPHSIHIVSFPSGYVPRELRIRPQSIRSTTHARRRGLTALARSSRSDLPLRLLLTRLLSSLSRNSLSSVDIPNPASQTALNLQALVNSDDNRSITTQRRLSQQRRHTSSSRTNTESQNNDRQQKKDNRGRDKRDKDKDKERGSDRDLRRSNSRQQSQQSQQQQQQHQQHQHQQEERTSGRRHPRYYPPNAMATSGRMSPSYHLGSARHSFASVRHAKSPITVVTEVPKPVATGSGVACSIILAERNLFLSGFDHDGHSRRGGQAGTALLRGRLQLTITKNVKIKAIQLKLMGRARTEWPEGIPPLKQDTHEEEGLRTQVLTFYNALNEEWETEYGNQCTFRLKNGSANSSTTNLNTRHQHSLSSHRNNLTPKELKRLSLQNVQSRSFGKGESGVVSSTQAKGFKIFCPGTYDYSFELPIDHHQLETTKVPYGSVKWELHATVDRAGAFKPNLHGVKEVPIIRLPDQLSLEMSEPISISRQWEDQLHYDIMVSGKSFPIGAKIPIAFKLTPLAKVQVHKIKVYITESIEYWTSDRRVTRKDPGRKILLLEKTAGKALDPTWASSDLNTIRGGELTAEQRRDAREQATRRRASEARRHGRRAPEPLPPPTENLLGDLDLGLESIWGSTEIEANVQIPTCEMMAKNKDLRLHPDCSWKNVNVFHWIKVVMRISRLDAEDPTGMKRRHFEISIDSPLTILNCRATQANTYLPAYSNPTSRPGPYQSACGCPDSATIATETSPNSSTGELPNSASPIESIPVPPQAAHVHQPMMTSAMAERTITPTGNPRPIHLLRAPSFSPPAFDDDVAPPVLIDDIIPPIMTPPPQYDAIIGTPSVDGLADYFARLADYDLGNEEDSGSDENEGPARLTERTGRVNVAHPRTPGGHRLPSRSLEITRPSTDLNLSNLHIANGVTARAALRNRS